MKLLIGIDGGGTKTDFVLCKEDGTVLKRVIKSASNPNDIGVEKSVIILKNGIEELLTDTSIDNVASLFAGISGGITGNNREILNAELKKIVGDKVIVNNHSDMLNALSSGIGSADGCVIIAGTGSIGYGRKNGKFLRVGGYGIHIDKGGSGYDFGSDALYYALCDKDGREKSTILTKLLEDKIGDLVENVGDIISKGKTYVASFAPVVFEGYRLGDWACVEIVKKNARELSKIFNTLAAFIGADTCPVVLAGGVFRDFDIIEKHLHKHLKYNFQFVIPSLPPVYGSVSEAAFAVEVDVDESFREKFKCTI